MSFVSLKYVVSLVLCECVLRTTADLRFDIPQLVSVVSVVLFSFVCEVRVVGIIWVT